MDSTVLKAGLSRFAAYIHGKNEGMFMTLGITLTALIFTVLAIGLLRNKVKGQTSTIGAQMKSEAVLEERQRLARELHDSLEQNLCGLALQLSAAERKAQNSSIDELLSTLSLAQKTLKHCQRECRESIYDLRGNFEELTGNSWHDDLLINEAGTAGAVIQHSVEGKEVPLDRGTGRHVSKIIREASFNALRHGKAQTLTIKYVYKPNSLRVTVSDNGNGFDTSVPLPKGHFGIIGMQERAGRINGKLTIESSQNKGTTLSLTLPI